jgi:hypothetical protein
VLTTVAKTTCVAVGTRFATLSVNDPLPESLAATMPELVEDFERLTRETAARFRP